MMYRDGKLPHPATKISTRTIIVDVPSDFGLEAKPAHKTVAYARVSSHKQKQDLQQQTNRILKYAALNGIKIDLIIEEIASGMNGNRPKLNKILANPEYDILIEHRDRLTRFAYEAIESALKAQGRTITVIDNTEIEDDLIRDMIEILTSFCARMYGKRGAKNKAQKALQTLQDTPDTTPETTVAPQRLMIYNRTVIETDRVPYGEGSDKRDGSNQEPEE